MLDALLLDPSIDSENIGDQIIRASVIRHLHDVVNIAQQLPTQTRLTKAQASSADDARLAIVGGTNLLSANMPWYRQWKLNGRSRSALGNKAVLMGVGWWQYQGDPNTYTRSMLRAVLSKDWVHSVRDEYTKNKLERIGIRSENTACPTMWDLTKVAAPRAESETCVVTLTNYNRDRTEDQWLLDLARNSYRRVVVWPQSIQDESYARELDGDFTIIEPSLAAYELLLESGPVDYVGTRLHGGVKAFQTGQWGFIVAVDNRAVEIGRDTGLPVFERGDRQAILTAITERRSSNIDIPHDRIQAWRAQFVSKNDNHHGRGNPVTGSV